MNITDFESLYKEMLVFCNLVESNSFSQTAKNLKLSQGTISNRLIKLEKILKTSLIARNSRNFSLTHSGQVLYDIFITQQEQIQQAFPEIATQTDKATLKAVLLSGISTDLISPFLGKFSFDHPQIALEVYYQNHLVNLIKHGIDVAVTTELPSKYYLENMGDSVKLSVTKLTTLPIYGYCTPEYIKRFGEVRDLEDLKNHRFVGAITADHQIKDYYYPENKNKRQVLKNSNSPILLDMPYQCKEIVKSGHILVFGHDYLFREELKNGEVIKVLPEVIFNQLPFYMIVRGNSPATLIFADFIKKCFAGLTS